MATKRKAAAMAPADEEPVDPADELMFMNLGGGNEVGRSCHIIQYKGKTVMVSSDFDIFSWTTSDNPFDSSMPVNMLDLKV